MAGVPPLDIQESQAYGSHTLAPRPGAHPTDEDRTFLQVASSACRRHGQMGWTIGYLCHEALDFSIQSPCFWMFRLSPIRERQEEWKLDCQKETMCVIAAPWSCSHSSHGQDHPGEWTESRMPSAWCLASNSACLATVNQQDVGSRGQR